MKEVQKIAQSFIEVYRNRWYGVITGVVFFLVLLIAVWLPNIQFLDEIFASPALPIMSKILLLITSLGALETNFMTAPRIITIFIALLFAINVSFLVYFLKKRVSLVRSGGMSAAGIILGIFGIGCASCGSVLISVLFGFGATASVIGLLPFHGLELGIISLILIVLSIVVVGKNIQKPLVCERN